MASALSNPIFHNEEAAYAHVEARIWPEGPFCPHCGATDRISAIAANPAKRVRMGLKKCGHCKKQFTVKVGTVFEQSHVPLNIWLQAIALLTSSKKGFSTNQLSRVLGVTIKTAWFMSMRIREAMAVDGSEPLGGLGKVLEIDETFLGHQPTVFVSGKGWTTRRNASELRKVVTIVERGGRARSIKVDNLRKAEMDRALQNASRDSALMTDQSGIYKRVGWQFDSHEAVDHGAKEYARGEVHTNTVEGTFSIFKRGMRGIYQHCAEKHLHRYLAEFDYRYSNRIKLGIDDAARAEIALKGIVGKRLTYRTVGQRRPGAEARVVW